jgi:PAS domain S-box-containing protein
VLLRSSAGGVAPSDGRESLLPRIRGLFVFLVVLFLGVEGLEWLDATTPLVPHRAVAAGCLALVLVWVVVLHRRGRSEVLLDVALALLVLGVGWGLGRPNAVVALLVGVIQLRSLYGSRRSVAAATSAVLAAYVAIAVLTGGWQAATDLGTLVVGLGAAALALVLRLVGEALAAHDLAAAWDAALTDAAEDLLVAASVEEVDAVASRALAQVRRSAERAVRGGVWSGPVQPGDVPRTPDELERGVRQGEHAALGTELPRTLRRLGADVALARERIDSEQRFRVLAENSREGIYVLELVPEPRFRYLNPAAERLLGRSAAAVYDDARSALAQVHPEDRVDAGFAPGPTVVEDPVRIRIVRGEDDVVWVEIQETVLERRGDEPTAVQGVARDITRQWEEEVSLRRALEQEAAAATELRALDEMKSTFLRAVSHELRTPLTAVLGSATTLRRLHPELSQRHVDQLLGAIDRQATRLARLLEDLLDVDRLSRGLVEPEREPVELLSLTRRVVDSAASASRPVSVEGEPVTVELDGPKVERIVENLVRNANKHTPEGTSIRVTVGRDDAGAVLSVEDDGPGMPPGLHTELFEPFAQGPSAHGAAASPGTGIGLALVSKLAELHDGRAWVEDRPGGGARFVVTLPGRVVEPRTGRSQLALP